MMINLLLLSIAILFSGSILSAFWGRSGKWPSILGLITGMMGS